jgi:hypothetical protein
MAWVGLSMTAYFKIMHKLNLLRVDVEVELAGLDASKYGMLTTNDIDGALGGGGSGMNTSAHKEGSRHGGYGGSLRGGRKSMQMTQGNTTPVIMSGVL